MTHAFYVYSSYAVASIVTVAVILWTWLDGRARQRELAQLDAAGHRRRSSTVQAPGEQA